MEILETNVFGCLKAVAIYYMLFQFKSSSSNCSIHVCLDFLSGGNFCFNSNLYGYLFVCFDLVICPRIDGFFGMSTFSVLILVFHELGMLCMRVKYFKKSSFGSAFFNLLNV